MFLSTIAMVCVFCCRCHSLRSRKSLGRGPRRSWRRATRKTPTYRLSSNKHRHSWRRYRGVFTVYFTLLYMSSQFGWVGGGFFFTCYDIGEGSTNLSQPVGYIGITLSVCPSVVLFVCPVVSTQYLLNRQTIFYQIWYSDVLSWGEVSCRKIG